MFPMKVFTENFVSCMDFSLKEADLLNWGNITVAIVQIYTALADWWDRYLHPQICGPNAIKNSYDKT
jgi:hypothetical protein